jgi:hypothetical protein
LAAQRDFAGIGECQHDSALKISVLNLGLFKCTPVAGDKAAWMEVPTAFLQHCMHFKPTTLNV